MGETEAGYRRRATEHLARVRVGALLKNTQSGRSGVLIKPVQRDHLYILIKSRGRRRYWRVENVEIRKPTF